MADFKLSSVENFTFTSVAAIVSKTATAPIERVKLLVQLQHEMIKQGKITRPYKGFVDCTVRTFKTEGLLPLWRGNLATCIRYFPTQAFNFTFKDKIKGMLKQNKADPYLVNFTKNIVSGGLAGALSLSFVYSLDFARTKLAVDTKVAATKRGGTSGGGREYSGLVDVYRKTLASDGIPGLYRGFVISCVGIIVYRGCYFGLYDTLRPILLGGEDYVGHISTFVFAYSVTITSGLIAYPFDTIRRRMMMTVGTRDSGLETVGRSNASKYTGSIDCAAYILKKEGFASLMKGAGTSIFQGIAGAIVLVGFDFLKYNGQERV